MKNLLITIGLMLTTLSAFAQKESPVKWSFESHKKSDNEYQVVLTATFAKPWHIYSQFTPEGGPLPTKISFQANPMLIANGSVKENGSLQTKHDASFGVDVKYFSDKVEFVQSVKIRSAAVKTEIRGTIEYMVCNDTKCLPPTKQLFDIKLQ
jgi:thiol:disulfide interchange protein DsbD